MSKYRHRLPHLKGGLFLTDGGLETTLVYHDRVELPYFAAFHLLRSAAGLEALRRYFDCYAEVARRQGVGVVLETPTWRANPDWAKKLGYNPTTLADANRSGVGILLEVRQRWEAPATPIVISGNVGPRGDGYRPEAKMSIAEAADYHGEQIRTFAETDADMVAAFTMNYIEEAAGIALSARATGMPVALSFTVETDGRLPSGEPLSDAISQIDELTGSYPVYYMINCAHPAHFAHVLEADLGPLAARVRGLRANASRRSHAELDSSTDLDAGNPRELALEYRDLQRRLPKLAVVGGCCGTDHRHVEAIGLALKGDARVHC